MRLCDEVSELDRGSIVVLDLHRVGVVAIGAADFLAIHPALNERPVHVVFFQNLAVGEIEAFVEGLGERAVEQVRFGVRVVAQGRSP